MPVYAYSQPMQVDPGISPAPYPAGHPLSFSAYTQPLERFPTQPSRVARPLSEPPPQPVEVEGEEVAEDNIPVTYEQRSPAAQPAPTYATLTATGAAQPAPAPVREPAQTFIPLPQLPEGTSLMFPSEASRARYFHTWEEMTPEERWHAGRARSYTAYSERLKREREGIGLTPPPPRGQPIQPGPVAPRGPAIEPTPTPHVTPSQPRPSPPRYEPESRKGRPPHLGMNPSWGRAKAKDQNMYPYTPSPLFPNGFREYNLPHGTDPQGYHPLWPDPWPRKSPCPLPQLPSLPQRHSPLRVKSWQAP